MSFRKSRDEIPPGNTSDFEPEEGPEIGPVAGPVVGPVVGPDEGWLELFAPDDESGEPEPGDFDLEAVDFQSLHEDFQPLDEVECYRDDFDDDRSAA